jgi:hypothetical protein
MLYVRLSGAKGRTENTDGSEALDRGLDRFAGENRAL